MPDVLLGTESRVIKHQDTHSRFGEFSQSLAGAGAELLSFPSAFTVKTGMAHWEPLLRQVKLSILL